MNARVTTLQMLPSKMDEGIGTYRDSIMPAARQQKGFKGLYLLTDRKTGKVISITLWETETDLTASENSGYYKQQLAKVKVEDLQGAPPVWEAYEVSVQA
ncbi:MAG: antibiotic biosynthesis monooxygenase [Syntrophorhabdales bacterium]|jgi:heme-degrading monooxygenase HmoA